MYTSGGENPQFRVENHRFEDDSPLHPLIKTRTHVAFKVDDIHRAIKNKQVILGPYFPFERFCVAIIDHNGTPIEFIQTDLSEDEIWGVLPTKSFLYPE